MAVETRCTDIRTSTSFLSLPRELRDQIYAFTLIDDGPAIEPMLKDPRLIFRDHDVHPSTSPLYTRASTLQIALEAREVFISRNKFLVYSVFLREFLSGQVYFDNRPGGFDIKQWVQNICIMVTRAESKTAIDLAAELHPLLGCPNLRYVHLFKTRYQIGQKKVELQTALSNIAQATEKIFEIIGEGLRIDTEIRYAECVYWRCCFKWHAEHSFGWDDLSLLRKDLSSPCHNERGESCESHMERPLNQAKDANRFSMRCWPCLHPKRW